MARPVNPLRKLTAEADKLAKPQMRLSVTGEKRGPNRRSQKNEAATARCNRNSVKRRYNFLGIRPHRNNVAEVADLDRDGPMIIDVGR